MGKDKVPGSISCNFWVFFNFLLLLINKDNNETEKEKFPNMSLI